MADRKERFALISKFEKLCALSNVRHAPMNKYNEQWAADALLESFTYDEIIKSMEYYFFVSGSPTWKGFANNVEKLIKAKKDREEDDRLRAERRQKAKEWLSESRG